MAFDEERWLRLVQKSKRERKARVSLPPELATNQAPPNSAAIARELQPSAKAKTAVSKNR